MDRDRRHNVWMVLLLAWVVIGVGLMSGPSSPGVTGGQILMAFLLVVLLVGVDRYREEREQWLDWQQWLIVITIVALVGSLDWEGLRAQGAIINVSPLVALLVALFSRRR